MADDAGTITARITLDTQQLERGVSQTRSVMGGFVSSFTELNSAVELAQKAFGLLSKIAFPDFVKQSLDSIDAQAKLATRLNTSVGSLQALNLAASEAGASSEILKASFHALNQKLGEAKQKTNEASHVFEALGIELNSFSKLQADEKIILISDRLKALNATADDSTNALNKLGITAPEAINLIISGGDGIRSAAEQVKRYGLELSSIDASAVEAANDAMGRVKLISTQLSNFFTAKFAPSLTALSNAFLDASDKSKELVSNIETGVGILNGSIRILLNSFDLVVKGFSFIGNAISAYFTNKILVASEGVEKFVGLLDKIPGVNLDGVKKSIESFNETLKGSLVTAKEEIKESLNADFLGEKFVDELEKAKEAARKAGEGRDANIETQSESKLKIKDPAEEARLAAEAAKTKAEEERKAKELEALKKSLADKVEAIKESMLEEQEILKAKFEQQDETLRDALENQVITEQEYNQIRLDAFSEYQQALSDIETRESDARKKKFEDEQKKKKEILSGALNGLTTLMGSHSKKQFEIGKAAAIAESIISTYQGMNEALTLGWPLGPIAAAAIGVAGFSRVQQIKAQTFNGGGTGSSGSASTSLSQAANQPEAAAPQQTRVATINLHGQLFGRDQVRSLIEQINEEVGDGATVRVA